MSSGVRQCRWRCQVMSPGRRSLVGSGWNETTLRNWVANELAERARQANPLSVSPSEFEELRRLRREVAELRVEKEILRKAAAHFAQETIRSACGAQ